MKLPLSLLTLALAATAHAQTPLDAVLKQMDAASKTFHSAQASVTYDNYTRVVRAHDIETGTIFVERSSDSSGVTFGALFFDLGPDGKPAKSPSKIISFDGNLLQVDSTGTNTVDVFKAGNNQAKYEGFLTLGFGGSGQALANAWTITDQGPETIDGIKTEKLDLVAKDPSVKSTFTHVTIWIDPARDVSLKQIFVAPNNDNRTATYTNIRLNAKIDKHPFTIPKSATRQIH
jgi:outer membrane lipoprotein-sorting protein